MRALQVGLLLACLPCLVAVGDEPAGPIAAAPGAIRSFHATPFEFNGDVRSLPGPALEAPRLAPGELRPMDDGVGEEEPFLPGELRRPGNRPEAIGPSPTDLAPLVAAPAPLASFEGMANADFGQNVVPPDPSGAVGKTHYVQFLNSSNGGTVGIYVKSTGVRASQFFYRTLFASLPTGTTCDGTGHSDPQVSYDSANDRFILMDITTAAPFQFCIAVSKTGDPVTGGFFLYTIAANQGSATLPDYEKMGIWPDGLYWGSQGGGIVGGATAWAADIAKMEAGLPTSILVASMGSITLQGVETVFRPAPSTFNVKSGAPPSGTPNYFMTMFDGTTLRVYKFHADFVTPGSSTFTGPTNVSSTWTITGATLTSTADPLDTLREHTIQASVYTNIGGVESLWGQHTVGNPSSPSIAVPRFFQIVVTGGAVSTTPRQDIEWRPDNTLSRFMTGVGVDQNGDMLLEYDATSSSLNPGIRYAGQLGTAALNTISFTEATLVNGGGGFSALCPSTCTRWGDYSNVSLDPEDGCTLWFTSEYMAATGLNWSTRIGAVALPGCSSCLNAANGTSCNDGDSCTSNDTCQAGTCIGTPVPPPGEVNGVRVDRVAGSTLVTWTLAPGSTRSDAVRGLLSALPVGPGGGDEACFDDISGASLSDATNPVPGSGFWYLIRGESACGQGPLGFATQGSALTDPRVTTTCP
ncbi:MAG TPA: hypothetical protein VFV19_08395 [Candidatus Polarisedimenticolaceae bacterium]|nr:hypothetical protein [Candidatus Polarisedimenticolaceae bacterium]